MKVTEEREAREKRAKELAATLPPGDYFAFDCHVVDHVTKQTVATCEAHWDACLVMMAAPKA